MIVKTKLYAHSSKDSNWTTWGRLWAAHRTPESLGDAVNDAGRAFSYTALEIEMDAEVDMATGEVRVTHFQGQPLPEAVSV